MLHQGKIVRKIHIRQIGLDRTLYDTAQHLRNAIVKIGDALHGTSKKWVIRDHLFISENKPLNAYKVADNERYLRDLDFILDARIEVSPLLSSDSVDLIVYTRDVFSLGGRVSPHAVDEYAFRIYDANFLGWGQRLQFNGLFENGRDPGFGSEILYQKSSIGGSLANLYAGYTTLNTGSSYGEEFENAYYLRIDRPLVSPYSRLAGGLELSRNWSRNFYSKSDSLFRKYSYYVYDVWMGYNIRIKNEEDRSRHFVGLRWFYQDFKNKPLQTVERINPLYNDNSYVLADITFFEQNFYKTRFIYGFGRTEDVPYGYKLTLSAGWSKIMGNRRPYLDADLEKTVANQRGNFFTANVRAATFLNSGDLEDATLLISLTKFSRLIRLKNVNMRQSFRMSYTAHVNRSFNQLLDINNDFGVRGFRTDSLRGLQRLGFSAELVFFTHWKLLGFRFAPLVFADLAFLDVKDRGLFHDVPFSGIGAGVRTRNENLIFGTVELRVTLYPRTEEDLSHFKVGFTSNLRLKYTGTFIRKPSFLFYN